MIGKRGLIGLGLVWLGLAACTPPTGPSATLELEDLPELVAPDCDAASLAPVGEPVIVNTTRVEYQRTPRVRVLSNGRIAVSWASDGQDGEETGVFAMVLDGDGTPLTDEIQVNQETTNDQNMPSMTALANGGFVIAWQGGPFFWEDLTSPDGSGSGVFARIYDGDGAPVTDEFQINDHAFHDQLEVRLTTMADGSFLASWTSAREFQFSEGAFGTDGFLAVKRYSADGEVLVEETVAQENEVIGSINLQIEPSDAAVAALEGGRFALAWEQSRLHPDEERIGPPYPIRVRARVYDATGRAVSGVIEVSQQSNAESTFEVDPRVAALPGGGFAVAWVSDRPDGFGVMLRHFDRNGTPRDSEYLALPGTGRAMLNVLAMDVTTVDEYGVLVGAILRTDTNAQEATLQIVGADGEALGAPAGFEINGSFVQTLSLHRGASGVMAMSYSVRAAEFANSDDVEVRIFDCP